MLIFADIRVTGVALDVGIELADTFRNLLVSHVDSCVSFFGGEIGGRGNELSRTEARCQQRRCSVELHHVELLKPDTRYEKPVNQKVASQNIAVDCSPCYL